MVLARKTAKRKFHRSNVKQLIIARFQCYQLVIKLVMLKYVTSQKKTAKRKFHRSNVKQLISAWIQC